MRRMLAAVLLAAIALGGCSAQSAPAPTLVASSSAAGFGKCEVTSSGPVATITPITPDVLTLATPLPFPGAYVTDSQGTVTGGYLFCLGAEIATRGGLSGVTVRNEPFSTIISGKASDFDMALVEANATAERSAVVAFAAPYSTSTTGVMVRTKSAVDESSIRSARIGVIGGALQQAVFTSAFPDATFTAFKGPDELAAALRGNTIDAAVIDAVVGMGQAEESNGELAVIAQYEVGGDVAPVLPKNTVNVDGVTQILESMRADGTLDAIVERWLAPSIGGNPADLPTWSLS